MSPAPSASSSVIIAGVAGSHAFDAAKLVRSLEPLTEGLEKAHVDLGLAVGRLAHSLPAGELSAAKLETLVAEQLAYMSQNHPDYSTLAARVAVRHLYREAPARFSDMCELMALNVDKAGKSSPLLQQAMLDFVRGNAAALDGMLRHERDMAYDYFGFKTLEKSYLVRVSGRVVERPQCMLMRAAVAIHMPDMAAIEEAYELMSRRYFTHASPTLFNAGSQRQQMSSCFLTMIKDDSIEGIYDTIKEVALISQSAGGIGMSCSNVRAAGGYIRSSGGASAGLTPMLRVFNATARYVDQGGGKRKGSVAAYLEPWHADICEFLELRKNHGKEEQRARDLFYGLWVPDLFMERVKANGPWTLFCPAQAPGLQDAVGEAFRTLYERYEREGRGRKTVQAQQLWFQILQSQIETGMPYMLYKDACNLRSNQQALGTIKCSNLCTEIIQYTSPQETAVCNLASVALPNFVVPADEASGAPARFDFHKLHEVVQVVTRSLNKVIDRNYYPVAEAKRSNQRHRPIGIGVQGFADALALLRMPFESPEALQLNKHIFETIYHGSCTASVDLAAEQGPYETFHGSPASRGKLQWHLWVDTEKQAGRGDAHRPSLGLWDWDSLVERVKTVGMRNSLLVAPMPTASTAQILGNNESFEPYTQNIYVRRVLSGEFVQVNRHLLRDLVRLGLWNDELKQQLIAANGSVQGMLQLPTEVRELYKTVWEIKQRVVLDMAAARGPYIDQSQSLNVHMEGATSAKLSSMHFYGWQAGLKTGLYYLRTRAAADPIKFTLDAKAAAAAPARRGSSPTAADEPPVAVKAKTKLALMAEAQEAAEASVCLSCGA